LTPWDRCPGGKKRDERRFYDENDSPPLSAPTLEKARLTGVWRFEAFRDNNGAATGVADDYFETTLGLIVKPRDWLSVRPVARYDWARGGHPFSDGTRNSQLTLAFDVIVLF
jgi:hypothetical protein